MGPPTTTAWRLSSEIAFFFITLGKYVQYKESVTASSPGPVGKFRKLQRPISLWTDQSIILLIVIIVQNLPQIVEWLLLADKPGHLPGIYKKPVLIPRPRDYPAVSAALSGSFIHQFLDYRSRCKIVFS